MADSRDELLALTARLHALRADVASATSAGGPHQRVHPRNRASAENLLHYVAFRRHDVRDLQADLSELGLSSLGRAEAHVLATLDAVRRAIAGLTGVPVSPPERVPVGFVAGDRLLADNAATLLGEARSGRRTRIMVTLPREAATDENLVHDVVAAGAELVRIRCAEGGPDEWEAMIRRVRDAEAAHGRTVRVTMDLAGPLPRTGPLLPGPQVLRVEPDRDELGRTTDPARLWLTTTGGPGRAGASRIPVTSAPWLERRRVGDRIAVVDARGMPCQVLVTATGELGLVATLDETAYLVPGSQLAVGRDVALVDALPERERTMTVRLGDELVLVRDDLPVDPGSRPARIGCTVPEALDGALAGHRVYLDDGLVGAVVEEVTARQIHLRVTDAAPAGSRLRGGRRIGLPDSTVSLPALTPDDVAHLPFVVRHADAVSLSSVRSVDDVHRLRRHLAELGAAELGLILKVETLAGFGALPSILLAAMQSPSVGVMIARGDLAMEAGYVRLGELQEEILWLCEAAHVPVIWATDVLDTLARTGRPSRAEVTDAASSGRAECVMLNHGPFVAHAVDFLDDILARMSDHQRKKQSLLRPLRAWGAADEPGSVLDHEYLPVLGG